MPHSVTTPRHPVFPLIYPGRVNRRGLVFSVITRLSRIERIKVGDSRRGERERALGKEKVPLQDRRGRGTISHTLDTLWKFCGSDVFVA